MGKLNKRGTKLTCAWVSPFKFEPEAAAFVGFRLHANAAAHPFSIFLDDGQANPGALVLGRETLKELKEL